MKSKRKMNPILVRRLTLFASILAIIIVGLVISMFFRQNKNISGEEIVIQTPTHELFEGEQIIQVVEGLPADINSNLRLGGGGVGYAEFIDHAGVQRNELTMAIFSGTGKRIVYAGFEWDEENYRIRVIEIDERGFAYLAVSEN